jgi:Uma2 family endonuclease
MENKNNEQEKENEVKEPALKNNYISAEEYLKRERISPRKHEYFNGIVVAMAGASQEHIDINVNLLAKIYNFLEDKDCRPLPSDYKIVSEDCESYTYPDLTIVCKDPMMSDHCRDTILNPSVIIEIVSKSTAKYDMGEKFMYYKTISCLKEYILIDSRKRFARIMRKQPDGKWDSQDIIEENGEVTIQLIGLTLSFDSIYRHTHL